LKNDTGPKPKTGLGVLKEMGLSQKNSLIFVLAMYTYFGSFHEKGKGFYMLPKIIKILSRNENREKVQYFPNKAWDIFTYLGYPLDRDHL